MGGITDPYSQRKSYVNMVMINRKKTQKDNAHTNTEQSIRIQGGVSAIDEIIKIEQHIEHANRDAEILLMDLSETFGEINRTHLWATMYKNGLRIETIKHIRRGHRRTKLAPEYKGAYVELSENNIGGGGKSAKQLP